MSCKFFIQKMTCSLMLCQFSSYFAEFSLMGDLVSWLKQKAFCFLDFDVFTILLLMISLHTLTLFNCRFLSVWPMRCTVERLAAIRIKIYLLIVTVLTIVISLHGHWIVHIKNRDTQPEPCRMFDASKQRCCRTAGMSPLSYSCLWESPRWQGSG